MDFLRNAVQIDVRIGMPFDAAHPELRLGYVISKEQADILYPGRPPMPEAPGWDQMDWQMRADRARSLANAIAADLAHKIVQACSPDWRREHAAELRLALNPRVSDASP